MNIAIKIELPKQPHLRAAFRYVTIRINDSEVTYLHRGTSITAMDYAQKLLAQQPEYVAALESEWNQRLTQ